MDVRLSSEQRALRDAAAQLVDRLGPKSVADLGDHARRDKLESALAASGWRELRSGSGDGNPWATAVEAALITEELGRGLADVAFLGPTLAADLRRLGTAPATQERETVAMAPDLAALARLDPDAPAIRAVSADAAGSVAALHLVATPDGNRLASTRLRDAVDTGIDLTRAWVSIDLAGTEAVAQPEPWDLSDDDLDRWNAFGLALACADLVGAMRGTIDLACAYAGTRRQYGAPIGSFQAVQHLLADAFVALEGSRTLALYAAWAVDSLPPHEALVAGATAKAYCARAAQAVCETSIQVHGGIGNTWECLAHVFLRRAIASSDLLGNIGPSLALVLNEQIGSPDGLR